MLAKAKEGIVGIVVGRDEIAEYLRLLEQAPTRIGAATRGVAADRLHARTDAEPWSVNDILAHVRSAADVRERFIADMARGDRTTLRYVSPRSELRKTNYLDLSFAENFAAFEAGRSALVDRLVQMPSDGWSRGALIRDRPETVAAYVGYLTEHELSHCDQIEALLG
jgi:DinB superfamily